MKRFAASFSVLCLSVLAVVSARAEYETIDGITWYYSIRDGEAKIDKLWVEDTASYRLRAHEKPWTYQNETGIYRYVYKLISLVVPSELGGFPVTSIADIRDKGNRLHQWQESR